MPWKLTYPVDVDGNLNNAGSKLANPLSVYLDDYISPWASVSGLTLTVSANGQPNTVSQYYCRTELRELDAENVEIAWSGSRSMKYSVAVSDLPNAYDSDDVLIGARAIIGQAKGDDIQGKNRELMRIYADKSSANAGDFVLYLQQDSDHAEISKQRYYFYNLQDGETKLPRVAFGDKMDFRVDVTAAHIRVTVMLEDGSSYAAHYTIAPNDGNTGRYFKAGVYAGFSAWKGQGKYGRVEHPADTASVTLYGLPEIM